ncbi:hypothetical protein OAL33_03045, partial [Akkermansiaceae bacterium]|nr:hypothetical protein [Akkermansiaceae bacterium]
MVYIISDSLSLPRLSETFSENISYSETYPFLVRNSPIFEKSGLELIANGSRGRTVDSALVVLRNEASHFSPSLVIIQIGIVDCAPRVLRKWQEFVISKTLPKIAQKLIAKVIKRYRKWFIILSLP